MRPVALTFLFAALAGCGSSATDPPPPDAGAEAAPKCAAFATYPCDCQGYQGHFTCTADGRPGACDCSVTQDSGPEACATPTLWYRDGDGDGHGAGVATSACAAPVGYVAAGDDCDDDDPRAFGGQTAFFGTPRPNGTFDFDCDGKDTRQFTELAGARCSFSGMTCIGAGTGNYWQGAILPNCGETASWILTCSSACGASAEQRTQGCK